MTAALSAHHPVVAELRDIVGNDGVLSDRDELAVYESDGFTIATGLPAAVVFPTTTAQVVEVVKSLGRHGLQIVPRGSGTGLTGGCVVFGEGVLVSTTRMNRIESIDPRNRVACVQAGVRNTALSEAVAATEGGAALHFSPDPSSQKASTIGGNVATNAGGINTLKHGVTTNHILGVEIVLADGSVVVTRPGFYDGIGPDLTALICGSEGTLGIITRIWCRLVPKPRGYRTFYAVFASTVDACKTVSGIIASGIVPASMEMMDGAMIQVVEEAFHYGFPTDAQALLLLEIDGVAAALDQQMEQIVQIAQTNNARDVKLCSDPIQRAKLWSARKRAFGAIGRISRSYCTQDACVPRSMLPEVMENIGRICQKYNLKSTSVFHAGDGNIHPVLLFDEDDPAQVQTIMRASHELLEYCVSIGGTITGEHGVGVEKMPLMHKMFNPATIHAFQAIKAVFDPTGLINDGKLIPSDRVRIDLVRPVSPNIPGGAL